MRFICSVSDDDDDLPTHTPLKIEKKWASQIDFHQDKPTMLRRVQSQREVNNISEVKSIQIETPKLRERIYQSMKTRQMIATQIHNPARGLEFIPLQHSHPFEG